MDILKLFILNMILLYFLKYNKKYVYIIFFIMILYLIFLNNNTIEGNSDGEREIKYLEMLNINKLLDNLVNLYKRGEKDCIGDFEEYSPCDKKCGKSHKYKRYRVNRPAGIYGNDCLYEDGFTQKKLCDINDNILPCNVGDPCKINEDCIKKSHCNPDTELCENNDSCTGNNLNKCNKIQCNKLSKINPHPAVTARGNSRNFIWIAMDRFEKRSASGPAHPEKKMNGTKRHSAMIPCPP